jgi:hypothetical protein
MPSPSDETIKITAEDLATVALPQTTVVAASTSPSSSGPKVYGTINEAAEQLVGVTTERGSVLLQGWFYLGLAGLLGALAGWAIAEPGFVDGAAHRWGNIVMIPIIITLMCVALGVSESAVERSVRKALLRGVLALPLGILLGFIFDMMANMTSACGSVTKRVRKPTKILPCGLPVGLPGWCLARPEASSMESWDSLRRKACMACWAEPWEQDSGEYYSTQFQWLPTTSTASAGRLDLL